MKNDQTTPFTRYQMQRESDELAPARGAVIGVLLGACCWLIAGAAVAAAVSCWKFAACGL